MLVVISDLHFEEEARDRVGEPRDPCSVQLRRNVSPRAFEKLKDRLIKEKEAAGAKKVDVVLAGDVFDIHRTAMWFDDPIRPWHEPALFRTDPKHEETVLKILNAIAPSEEPRSDRDDQYDVWKSLEVIRSLKDKPLGATLHYIPGNHDRLVNVSPLARTRVGELLGVAVPPGGFHHLLLLPFEDPLVLVRHGHEYGSKHFVPGIPERAEAHGLAREAFDYDAPTLLDFGTVVFGSLLQLVFREMHGDSMLNDKDKPGFKQLYLRLLEYDDVRPLSALVGFLLEGRATGLDQRALWDILTPVFDELLRRIEGDPFLGAWLPEVPKTARAFLTDVAGGLLDFLPLPLIRLLAGCAPLGLRLVNKKLLRTVGREAAANSKIRAVIAGHTHTPRVELIGTDRTGERYYIDTGTWRKRVLASADGKSFGRLKALTYVVVYGRNENRRGSEVQPGDGKSWSFDYWSGFRQRW